MGDFRGVGNLEGTFDFTSSIEFPGIVAEETFLSQTVEERVQ